MWVGTVQLESFVCLSFSVDVSSFHLARGFVLAEVAGKVVEDLSTAALTPETALEAEYSDLFRPL